MKTFYRKLKNSKEPKHLRIYNVVVEAIKDGTLKALEPLPSSRELAKLYDCHRLTVMTAMQSLVAEGWLESAERSHYKVSEKIPITTSKESVKAARRECSAPVAKNKPPHFDLEKAAFKLAFWGGTPDLRLFPMKEFRSVMAESLKRVNTAHFGYGFSEGLPQLKKQVSAYLRRTRNLLDRELIITNGSQEALYIIAQTYIKPGDRIVIERKGYPPVWRLFESLGAELVTVSVDDEGLNTAELNEVVRKAPIKMIYTTPLHQYPTTVGLSPRGGRS